MSPVTASLRISTQFATAPLRNLDRLVGKKFLFVALPIKIRDGSGCPVRAVALEL